jgi:hypothetical protein
MECTVAINESLVWIPVAESVRNEAGALINRADFRHGERGLELLPL